MIKHQHESIEFPMMPTSFEGLRAGVFHGDITASLSSSVRYPTLHQRSVHRLIQMVRHEEALMVPLFVPIRTVLERRATLLLDRITHKYKLWTSDLGKASIMWWEIESKRDSFKGGR